MKKKKKKRKKKKKGKKKKRREKKRRRERRKREDVIKKEEEGIREIGRYREIGDGYKREEAYYKKGEEECRWVIFRMFGRRINNWGRILLRCGSIDVKK